VISAGIVVAGRGQSCRYYSFDDQDVFALPDMMKDTYYFTRFIIASPIVVAFLYYVHYDSIKNKAGSIVRHITDVTMIPHVPAVRSNESLWPMCATGRPCSYTDVVDIRVIVITFNRPVSLSKLLLTLQAMAVDGDRAALEIWIDIHRRRGSVDQRTLEVASAFNWKVGPTRVHVQVSWV